MKSLSSQLRAHYRSPVHTLARCWKITRQDGQVYGFTSIDLDFEYDGTVYRAATGMTGFQIQQRADMSVDNTQVSGLLDSSVITEEDLEAGLWDGAHVEVFEVNDRDLSMGHMRLPGWKLGIATRGTTGWQTEILGLSEALRHPVGEVDSPLCQARLGDSRCGVDLEALRETHTVTSVFNRRSFTASAFAQAAGWATYGLLTWTVGSNAGLSLEVTSHEAGGVLTLALGMPYDIEAGDEFTIVPGCNKIHSLVFDADLNVTSVEGDCANKFSNVINFRGFNNIPGNDRTLGDGGYEDAPDA